MRCLEPTLSGRVPVDVACNVILGGGVRPHFGRRRPEWEPAEHALGKRDAKTRLPPPPPSRSSKTHAAPSPDW